MKRLLLCGMLLLAVAFIGCNQAPQTPPPSATPVTPGPTVAVPPPTAPPVVTTVPIAGAPAAATPDSAKLALRRWVDCFITGDGNTFYDMLPMSARSKLEAWFTRLSNMPAWKADPESAKVPTARSFLNYSFQQAKAEGSLLGAVTPAQFDSIAATCKMNGNNATFTGKDGKPLTFILEADGWKMDNAFANYMVDSMIAAVDQAMKKH